ncbi:MAG: hypothetical protein SOX56_08270 [[Pasteurella] mairii]|uniref:Uncharacterized protein n=1 Tax=[Pasteurella] mairii TaxID=757 RepID=A0A379B589_9PAST|nr:hypothetical protein [[Pasteurella] mairii]SUB33773.1 Uncharacterised protein [[Pasteurella] mairii]
MWKKQVLTLSPQAKLAIENNAKGINSPFVLSAKGTKIGVHNWSHGVKEQSNYYLSPRNAVKVFAEKLTDYSDPQRPQGEQEMVALMVTSGDMDEFIAKLEKVRVLLAEPAFKQALDYAKSSKSLQETKMIKTPTISYPAFGGQADITPSANRAMQSILRNSASGVNAKNIADPMTAIQSLLQKKAEREKQNQQKVTQMLTTSAEVYAFITRGRLEQAEMEMQLNIPSDSNIYTACVLFIGDDLSSIRGMLVDVY